MVDKLGSELACLLREVWHEDCHMLDLAIASHIVTRLIFFVGSHTLVKLIYHYPLHDSDV